MNSSDFFRAHWSRHLCCKALADRQAHVQPTSPSIYIEGTSSLITLSPSLVDPALVSVVREVDGQETGLSVQLAEKKNRLQTARTTSTERTGPGFSAFKASADRPAQKNATSDVISSQPIVCPSDQPRSWSHVFTDQKGRKCVLQNSRLLWFQSLLCRPGLVVGSGVLWTVKLPVKHHTKNANTDVISS